MKVNLAGYLATFALACITLCAIPSVSVWAGEAEDFLAKLKKHYQITPQVKAFSLTQHYLQASPDQAWDYQAPNRWTALKVTEFDLDKKHYFENAIHHFTGGLRYDEVHFQDDKQSLRYERNGIPLGKRILRQSMGSFERYKNIYLMNIDFLAVKPLLEETDIANSIAFSRDKLSGETTLTHTVSKKNVKDYVFSHSPLRLVSINEKSRNRISVYSDYQTTNGLTFARSISKYYGGKTRPRFIKRIDRFDIIKEVDPGKFQVPKEYGPIIPKTDRALLSEKIAPDLYLVSDVAARHNTLFTVSGNEIKIFGGPASLGLAQQTIKLILEQFPKKNISSVYISHPHSDHIDGLPAYAKHGIAIRADAYTIAAIKAYPDFADGINDFKFQVIEHNQLLDGVRFYVLENAHAKRQSFVHFERQGIIYQADFLEVAFDNTIAKILPSYSKTFIDFVRSSKLIFSRIVAHQSNNNISPEVMEKTYQANIM